MAEIIVVMEGGIVQDVGGIPRGTTVIIRDYDCDGYDDDVLETDEYGDKHHDSIYEGPETNINEHVDRMRNS